MRPAIPISGFPAAAVLAATLAACGAPRDDGVPVVTLYYAPEQQLQAIVDACTRRAGGRYRIVHHVLPRHADEQRVQLARRLAAGDDGMDVLGLDVTWTPELANAGWIREWTGSHRDEAEAGTLEAPLRSARWQGRLYAAPKNTNVQLLWYRGDLVTTPPRTWDELIAAARHLRAAGRPYRVLATGARYEGLVVLFNTLVASAGGRLVGDDGRTAVVDEGAVTALDTLRRFTTAGVTSASFANAMEDDVRLAFQTGDAAFQLNWPYVWAAMRTAAPELASTVRWARYPAVDAGRPSRVTIGGFNLAVSTFSRRPDDAFEAALCLRNAEHQKQSALHAGVPPTLAALYDDPELAAAYPMRDLIRAELADGATRPATPAYQNVSAVLAATLSAAADHDPATVARGLHTELQAALESRSVLP